MIQEIIAGVIVFLLSTIIGEISKKLLKAIHNYSQAHKITFLLRCFAIFSIFSIIIIAMLLTQVNLFSLVWFLLLTFFIILILLLIHIIYDALNMIETMLEDKQKLIQEFKSLIGPNDEIHSTKTQ